MKERKSAIMDLFSSISVFFVGQQNQLVQSLPSSIVMRLKVAVSYKSGRICAQLPFPVPQFNLRRSLYSLRPTSFIVFASRFFPRRLALRFHAFKWQLATSRPDLRSATTFRSTIPSSPISLLFTSDVVSSSSHLALFFSYNRSSCPCL